MKLRSLLILIFTSGLLFCLMNLATAAQILQFENGKNGLQVISSDLDRLELINQLSQAEVGEMKHGNQIFNDLRIAGYGYTMEVGQPRVPVLRQLIEIPQGATVSLQIDAGDVIEFDLARFGAPHALWPAQPPQAKNQDFFQFEFNPLAYQQNNYIELPRAAVENIGRLRDRQLGLLTISPIEYNPVQNSIRVFTQINVTISFSDVDYNQILETKQRLASPYFGRLDRQVLNPLNSPGRDTITRYPISYVIVSPRMFEAALQPFIAWKQKKGFNVIEAYTDDPVVGSTTTSIQAYLEGLFNTMSPAPTFVLFVGDVDQIPPFDGDTGSHVSDLYYCEYTGDNIPDVFYGRFSATTVAELEPQIDKTLEYEQYQMADPSFLNEAVLIAGVDSNFAPTHGNGQINYGTTYYFNAAHGLTTHTYLYPESGSSDAQIRADVSNGVAFANYTAHGSSNGWADPSFSVSDVANLQNSGQYPLMVGNACLTNTFDVGVCFGEALLRAANKGAIGYIGGSNSTYWDEDYHWGVGFGTVVLHPTYETTGLGAYDRTFHENGEPESEWYPTQGSMIMAGNLAVTESGSSLTSYYWEIYHLMGDPSLMVYIGEPAPLTADYNVALPLGINQFTVTTEPGAYVAISMDGELHGAALANAAGQAVVNLTPFAQPGTADVVITAQKRQPHLGTITVAPADGPFLIYSAHNVNDLSGNANNLVDFGETITLDVSIENLGNAAANDVEVTLSSGDSHVGLLDQTEDFGTVPANQTASRLDAFRFIAANNIPDQHVMPFVLTMVSPTRETWTANFSITANAPELVIGLLQIDDSAGGDGNGQLDAGETAFLTIPTTNTGHSLSSAAIATLASSSPYVTIISGVENEGPIAPNATVNSTFEMALDAETPIGEAVSFNFQITADQYSASETFNVSVGLIREDFETGDFSRFNWTFSGNADWQIDQNQVYEGAFSAKSGTISHSQRSELSVEVDVTAAGTISFYRKVSSESSYDFLRFYIDETETGSWSGTQDWQEVSYDVAAGRRTFTWAYTKDGSVSTGDDAAWIDYIVFPALGPPSPQIGLSTDLIDFGEVFVGVPQTRHVIVSNVGSAPLNISSIVCGHPDFSIGVTSLQLDPGQTHNLTVTFTPSASGLISGALTLASDDPDDPQAQVALQGEGITPPDISVDPTALTENLLTGEMVDRILNITNNGASTFYYDLEIEEVTVRTHTIIDRPQYPDVKLAKGEADPRVGKVVTRGAGGPDVFGYHWIDSDEAGGPVFNWVDISALGTSVSLSDDDSEAVTLPFAFPFYGEDKTSLTISSNGYLTFGTDGTVFSNDEIPDSSTPNDIIAPFWDDLNPGTAGTIYYYHDAGLNRFIVQYDGVPRYGDDSSSLTFQAILQANGVILFQYQEMLGTMMSSTVGIENSDGSDGLPVAFNTNYVHSGLAIRFSSAPAWIVVDPMNGIIAPSQTAPLNVAFNAAGMLGGQYRVNLNICTGGDPIEVVPVTLNVTGAPDISLSADTIDFGNHFIGATVERTISVSNAGTDQLTITSITSSNGEFAAAPTNFSLSPGQNQAVTVTYQPAAAGAISGHLTVSSDDPDEASLTIALTGTGEVPPDIAVSPAGFSESLLTGGMVTRSLTISNEGNTDLTYTLWVERPTTTSVRQEGSDRRVPRPADKTVIPKGRDYQPGEVIVKLNPKTSKDDVDDIKSILGATVKRTFRYITAEVWTLSKKTVADAIKEFGADARFDYIEPNYKVYALETIPNDPRFADLWGLHNTGQSGGTEDADIDAPEAWDVETGNEVIVGVIDTGVDYTHEDLAANIWVNTGEIPGNGVDDDNNGYVDDVHGYDFVNNDGDPMDGHGHGTHCSGTIAGVGNNGIGVAGVNWNAKIMGLKFLDDSGSGNTDDAIGAVEYAILMGAQLTSNSWGGGGAEQAMYDAIEQAGLQANQLFIAAAGNDYGNNNDSSPTYPCSYDLNNIISVASVTRSDAMSDFSNYGPTSVDLGAPGSDILSSTPGNNYEYYSGTSMATPHVAGAAALLWAAAPQMSNLEIKEQLLTTVDLTDAMNGRVLSNGRLNIANAMRGLITWLQLSPEFGTVPAGQSVTIDVLFDATGLEGGQHDANIIVSSNDPDESMITVPATLNVTGAPDIAVSPASLDFGTYYIGQEATQTVRIMNVGTDMLNGTVSVVGMSHFSADVSHFNLTPGTHETVAVTFSPAIAGTLTGSLVITSNDADQSTINVNLTGVGTEPPVIFVSTSQLVQNLEPDQTAAQTFTIRNDGGDVLHFNLAVQEAVVTRASVRRLNPRIPVREKSPQDIPGKDEPDLRRGDPVLKNAGGPDTFGYNWIDSNEPGGPVFDWFDISGLGTVLNLSDDDSELVNLPFDFIFYGETKTSIHISSNGYLTFGATGLTPYLNQEIPVDTTPNDVIAPFWDDLNPGSAGDVYYYHDSVRDRFIVQYHQVPHYNQTAPNTFQVMLYGNGTILYQYLDMGEPLDSATIGIENSTGGDGLQVVFNATYVENNLAVKFSMGPEWIVVTPEGGSLAPGADATISVEFNSAGLEPGSYSANLAISSNATQPLVNVSAALDVGGTVNHAPNTPANPAPAHNSTVGIEPILSWTGGDPDAGDIVTYDVYFGTNQNLTTPVVPGHNTTTYNPGTLLNNTQYFWKIVAHDNHGLSTPGPVWTFSTEPVPNNPPNAPANPQPADNAVDIAFGADLSWIGSDPDNDPLTYLVYFGTTTNFGAPVGVVTNGTTFDPGQLAYQTEYFWQIVADDETEQTAGPIWSFTTRANPNQAPNAPANPIPVDDATDVALEKVLEWTGGDPDGDALTYEVYFGTTPNFSIPAAVLADETTYSPGQLAYQTEYFWQIVADDGQLKTVGPIWSFTTLQAPNLPPLAPSSPVPADDAINIVIDPELSWTGGDPDAGDTVTYDVYFGTTANFGAPVAASLTAPTFDPGQLAYQTDYFWQIVASDGQLETAGPVWSFTTLSPPNQAPLSPSNPDPVDGAVDVALAVDLSWTGGDPDAGDTVTYDVYFGTTANFGAPVAASLTAPTFDPGQLAYQTDYFWQIVASDGELETAGPVWSFTTLSPPNQAPLSPSNPDPADGAVDVALAVDLSWTGGDPDAGDTVTYDVYFGTTANFGAPVAATQVETAYDPGQLAYQTDYFWQIVASDGELETAGPVWSFTTVAETNDAPYLEIMAVDGEVFDDLMMVHWMAEDSNDEAMIYFYLDDDMAGFDGDMIIGDIPEHDGENAMEIHVDMMDEGEYYLYGMISDEVTRETMGVYYPEPLLIVHRQPGDLNNDGIITPNDVYDLIIHIFDTSVETDPVIQYLTDVNGDGMANIIDVIQLVNQLNAR